MSKPPIQFKDSPLDKIPEDWDVVSLSSLFQIQTGATPLRNKHQAYFVGGKIPWVKTMDLNEGWITQTDECITEVALRECSVQLLPPKTVLVAMYGGWEQIGRTSILRDAATTNQAISSLVKISPFIEPEFALRALQYERHRWKGIAASTRKDPNITRDDVENFLIPLPPLSEQQGIAAILNMIDSTIAHTFTLIAKLKQMKAGLLHDLLTRGLDENGELRDAIEHPEQFKDSPLGRIPKDWNVSSVNQEFDITAGFTLGEHRRPRKNRQKYLRVANVRREEIVLDDIAELEATHEEVATRLLEENDLLIVEGHANPEEIGRCALVPPVAVNLTFQNHLFRLRSKKLIPKFALMWLNGEWVRAYWRCLCGTSSGLNTINRTMLNAIPVPIPAEEEQSRIIAVLDAHNTRISSEEAYLSKLKEQKKGLMHDLLTGRVRVTDLKGIPA